MVRDRSLLGLDLFDSALEIGRAPFALIHARNEDGSVCEEILHLLKRALGGLRQEAVEEDGVGQVTDLWSWSVVGHDSLEYSGKTYDKQ